MIYGYVRVSARDQNEDRQLLAMAERKIPKENIFLDKQSGKDFNRENYKRLMEIVKADDMIVVKSIDRFGRNYQEIIEQWRYITKTVGADIVVLDMPLLDTTQAKDLVGTLISDIVLQLLSFVAENERQAIKARQLEGITAAKMKGIKFGRPGKFSDEEYRAFFKQVRMGKLTRDEAMKLMGISYSSFYRIRNKMKNEAKAKGEINLK